MRPNVCRSGVCGYCELPGHASDACPDAGRAMAEACDCGACCPQCGHYEGCISGLGRPDE